MEKSLWSDSVELPKFDRLNKDKKVDVLIIGGGICGILCAYLLKQAGIDYILVEADRIAQGITCNTTAKITSLHGLIYDELIGSIGKEGAQKYLTANENAVKKYDQLCNNIDCDYKTLSSYTYSINNRSKIEKEVRALNDLGVKAKFSVETPLPFEIDGCVGMKNQAQFNPLKFIASISKDLNIYENTMVYDIKANYALCDGFKIHANKIIVATHFPFMNKHGSYFLKQYQHRSYVLAIENAQDVNGLYVDEAQDGLSFRNSNNLLLLGGGGKRTGKPCGNWRELIEFQKQYYHNSKVIYKWATQDCMTLDKIPYIGQYSANTPNLYVATGFNKWGITSSMVAATILCDMIQDIKNVHEDIFSPSRSILKPQLLANGFEAIINLAYPTTKRCPHLGCALKWNKAEHTWDCSCHGSRFEKDGILINNPAKKDAKVEQK
ncbi:MAG: FAD-dependent oxidoreductase [Eubacteriales bacterium]|nr:FAD-dependent oxidoreductase [Eubacteriales bacterium]